MKIIRYQKPELLDWTSFEPLSNLQEEVNRLFNAAGWGLTRNSDLMGGWNPALDLIEEKDALVVRAELPGMKREDFDISVHDGVLSISGERKQEKEQKDGESVRSERFFGRFQRTLSLPKPVAVDKAKASYKDGILTINLPKTEEAKPKQIQVALN